MQYKVTYVRCKNSKVFGGFSYLTQQLCHTKNASPKSIFHSQLLWQILFSLLLLGIFCNIIYALHKILKNIYWYSIKRQINMKNVFHKIYTHRNFHTRQQIFFHLPTLYHNPTFLQHKHTEHNRDKKFHSLINILI